MIAPLYPHRQPAQKYPPAVWASNVCLSESGTCSLASWQMSEDLIFEQGLRHSRTFKDIQAPKSFERNQET